jgi:hypothetical protein
LLPRAAADSGAKEGGVKDDTGGARLLGTSLLLLVVLWRAVAAVATSQGGRSSTPRVPPGHGVGPIVHGWLLH